MTAVRTAWRPTNERHDPRTARSAGGRSAGGPEQPLDQPIECPDLRRAREREVIERLLLRAECLPRRDEILIRAVLEDGRRVTDVAIAAGVCPRLLRGRVKRLIRRLATPQYAFVATRIGEWTATRRKVADACYLQGLSMADASRQLGMSRHQVRFHRDAVDALFQMEMARLDKARRRGRTPPARTPIARELDALQREAA